jgi:hypothetical protein
VGSDVLSRLRLGRSLVARHTCLLPTCISASACLVKVNWATAWLSVIFPAPSLACNTVSAGAGWGWGWGLGCPRGCGIPGTMHLAGNSRACSQAACGQVGCSGGHASRSTWAHLHPFHPQEVHGVILDDGLQGAGVLIVDPLRAASMGWKWQRPAWIDSSSDRR